MMFNQDDLAHLSGRDIKEIHDGILEGLAGLKGDRPNMSVEALVGRLHMHLQYQPVNSIVEVAALYAEVIAKGHVFNDANKRTALVSMLAFLDLNGYTLTADQNKLADQIVFLAEGQVDHKKFSIWLGPKVRPS